MRNKIIYILVTVLLLMICLVACKENIEIYDDTSSANSITTSIPIIIVDDEDASEQPTQSEIDEIDKIWENQTPNINVEVGTSDSQNNSNSLDNSSDTTTSDNNDTNDSSSNDSSDATSSTDSSEESNSTDSSNTESGDNESGKEDDGYFDVAV